MDVTRFVLHNNSLLGNNKQSNKLIENLIATEDEKHFIMEKDIHMQCIDNTCYILFVNPMHTCIHDAGCNYN